MLCMMPLIHLKCDDAKQCISFEFRCNSVRRSVPQYASNFIRFLCRHPLYWPQQLVRAHISLAFEGIRLELMQMFALMGIPCQLDLCECVRVCLCMHFGRCLLIYLANYSIFYQALFDFRLNANHN